MNSNMQSILASHYFSIFLLLVVYLVGLAGFTKIFHYDNFESLTPFNLLFSLIILMWKHKKHNQTGFLFFIAIFFSGYFVEFAGVKTQMIFGTYWYGNTLGIKLFDIPLMIGINWVLLVYICACVANTLSIGKYLKAIVAAILMVSLDYFIEPFAMKYDLWQWQNNVVPFQNYLAWFVIGLIMQLAFFYTSIDKNNTTAVALYFIQLVFFGILLLA